MEAKQKTNAQLLSEARAKGRRHLENFELREHAPIWGMKTYSWMSAGFEDTLELLTQLDNPVVWLVSADLNVDFSRVSEFIQQEVHAVIAFGSSNKGMREALEGKVAFYTRKDDFHEALHVMKSVANPGYTLLVAPGNSKLNSTWSSDFEDFLSSHTGC